MDYLAIIQAPIKQEIDDFSIYFKQQFTSNIGLLNSALSYVSESAGKLMRPMLVLLIAKSLGKVSERAFAAASAMELLHSASLLHDDVIDESDKRRGRPSLNITFNNNIAVLTGDYLFSQALNNAAKTGDIRIIEELAKLGKELSSGEVLQVELEQEGTYSEENYFKVIYNKTASLFVCSCACAVYTAGGSDEIVFTDNGSFEFTYADEAGNTGSITAKVSKIDKKTINHRTVPLIRVWEVL